MDTTTTTNRGVDCLTNNIVDVPEVLNLDAPSPLDNINWKVMTKKSGHRHISWNQTNQIQLSAARILWESFVAEGMEPFRVGKGGKATGKKLDEFDVTAEDVIFMPKKAMVGG